jgi:hypothetical protein
MSGIVLIWDEDKERWVLPHERGWILMPTECPKGKPCPEGFSDPAWCTVCLDEAMAKSKANQVADSVELDDDDIEDLREAIVTAEPNKQLITTTGPPSIGSNIDTAAITSISTGKVQTGNMIRNVTTARYDSKCRSCSVEVVEGRTLLAGVKRSFYDSDPLRWLCQDCGLLYEQAYSQLINKHGSYNNAEETISNGTVLLVFRWNEDDRRWNEVRTRHGAVARLRTP